MIDINLADELVDSHCMSLEIESCLLEDLYSKVLAKPIHATRDSPPFDRVAMDGIAFRYSSKMFPEYKIEGIQKAGTPGKSLIKSDGAIEVMTGSVLPSGTDTVIPYEQFEIENGICKINKTYEVKQHSNIHTHASDHKEQSVLLNSGTLISTPEIALIAGQGLDRADVFKLPKVAIISTGDELRQPGEKCEMWQIWRSNPFGIKSELLGLGFENSEISMIHLEDDLNKTLTTLAQLLKSHQLIILSGGVSMGKYDFVHTSMNDLGVTQIFHKIKQKPGKPLYFGKGRENQLVFGLPGNPVSALVCMRRYVNRSLKKSLKQIDQVKYVKLSEDLEFKKPFTLFKAANLQSHKTGELIATAANSNGSGDFTHLAGTDGFIELPADQTLYKKGQCFPFYSWTHK